VHHGRSHSCKGEAARPSTLKRVKPPRAWGHKPETIGDLAGRGFVLAGGASSDSWRYCLTSGSLGSGLLKKETAIVFPSCRPGKPS
jgi:hypothetical protein